MNRINQINLVKKILHERPEVNIQDESSENNTPFGSFVHRPEIIQAKYTASMLKLSTVENEENNDQQQDGPKLNLLQFRE